jgi:hypothetical protein
MTRTMDMIVRPNFPDKMMNTFFSYDVSDKINALIDIIKWFDGISNLLKFSNYITTVNISIEPY